MRVLVIHGFMHNSKIWKNFESLLKNKYECVVDYLAMSGFDNNIRLPKGNSYLNSYTAELSRMLVRYSYDLIIAHSMGAYLMLKCMDFAMNSKIVFMSPMIGNINTRHLRRVLPLGLSSGNLLAKVNKRMYEEAVKRFTKLTVYGFKYSDEMVSNVMECDIKVSAEVMSELLKAGVPEFKLGKAGNCLFLYGNEDRILHASKIMSYANKNHIRSIIFNNVGHCPFLEKPTEVMEEIDEFLRGERRWK